MNCVVVGYGYSGKQFHCYLIKLKSNSLNLYGVVARNEQNKNQLLKEQEGCVAFSNLSEALVDPLVHVVVIASANITHAPLALEALKARKHVIVEKPLALSVKDALELDKVAKENNLLLTAFQNRRWDGDFMTVQKLLKENKLGNPQWIELSWSKYGVSSSKLWKLDSTIKGGGRFWDFASHLLDQLLILTSPALVTSVFCTISYTNPSAPETDTHTILVLKFSNNVTAIINTSSHTFHEKPHWLICGDTATYVKEGFDPQESAMIKGDIEDYKDEEMVDGCLKMEAGKVERVKQLRGEWWRFYANVGEVLEGKSELVVKMSEVIRVLSIIETGLKSAATGQVIQVSI